MHAHYICYHAACTMHGDIFSAHVQTTTYTKFALLFVKWVDKGVVYPFDYPVYNYSDIWPASGN